MGLFDQAKDFADKHEDQVDNAAGKAGEFVNEKTDGKYEDQINKGVEGIQNQTGSGDNSQQQ